MLGLAFPIPSRDGEVNSPYLRFDILDKGIIFITQDEDIKYTTYGKFEGQEYDRLANTASKLASIGELAIYADAV